MVMSAPRLQAGVRPDRTDSGSVHRFMAHPYMHRAGKQEVWPHPQGATQPHGELSKPADADPPRPQHDQAPDRRGGKATGAPGRTGGPGFEMSRVADRRPGPDSLARNLVLLLVGLAVAAAVLLVFDPIPFEWLEAHPRAHLIVDELILVAAIGIGGLAWVLWRYRADLAARLRPRDELETALSEARGTWRALVEHIPDFVLTLDPEGRITSINHTLPHLDKEEVVGTPATDWMPLGRREDFEARVAKVVQEDTSQEYEVESVGEGDEPAVYDITLGPIHDGESVVGVTLLARDITAERDVQEGLARQTDLYRTLVDAQNDMGQGVVIFDLEDCSISYANDAFYELLDRSPRYVDALPDVTMLVEEEARTEVLEKMAKFTEGAAYVEHTFPIRDRAGRRRWLHASGRRLEEAHTTQIVVTVDDITEQRRREKERELLQQVTEDLAEAPDLEAGLETILGRLGRLDGWQIGEAWLQDEDGGPLQFRSLWTTHPAIEADWQKANAEVEIEPGMLLPGKAWDGMGAVWVEDVTAEPEFRRRAAARRLGLGAAVAVPIRARGETLAVLALYNRARKPEDEDFVECLSAVGSQIGETLRRRHAEEQTIATLDRLDLLVSRAPVVIFEIDTEGTITMSEGRGLERLGLESGEHVGEDVFELYGGHPRIPADIRRALDGEQFEVEREIGDVHFRISYSPLRDDEGGIVGTIGMAMDVTDLETARSELERSANRLQQAQELAQVGDWYWEMRTDEITWSDELARIHGHPPGWTPKDKQEAAEVAHPDDREQVLTAVQRAIETGEIQEIVHRIVRPDGEVRWVHARIEPVTGAAGEVVALHGTSQDITELKVAEQRLVRAQDIAGIADWELDLETDEATWSQASFELYEVDPAKDAPNFDEFLELVLPEDHHRIQDVFDRLPDEDGPFEVEFRVRHGDGDLRWIWSRIEVDRDADGVPIRLVGTDQDITERKRAQAETERQARMLDEVGQAVIVTDLDGTVTYWNAAAEDLYGYASDDALGRSVFELTVPKGAEIPAREIMETLRRGETWRGEFDCRRKDGTTFPAYVSDAPLLDVDGELVGIIGVSHDMTREKQRQDALLKSRNEVEARNRHLRDLGQATPHPFQEAVRDVVRYLQLLEDDAGDHLTKEDLDHLNTAVEGAKSLQRLVDDVAAFIKVTTDQPDPGPVDAGDVLEDVLGAMADRIDDPSVTVTHDQGPLLGMGREELEILLAELVGNALGFRTGEDLHIHIGFEREDNVWLLSVEDDGPGIPERYHERIFRPFQTMAHRSRGAGTGVGLTLCRSIVEAHGGNMWVVSRLGEGATFHATLPMPDPLAGDDTDPEDEIPVTDDYEEPVTYPETTDRTP